MRRRSVLDSALAYIHSAVEQPIRLCTFGGALTVLIDEQRPTSLTETRHGRERRRSMNASDRRLLYVGSPTTMTTSMLRVVSFIVASRTKEVGIRSALGATKLSVMRLLLASGVVPVVVGMVAGLLLAAVAGIVVSRILSNVNAPVPMSANNPSTFASAALLLVTTVAAAMSLPAWRAARGNPIDVLREE